MGYKKFTSEFKHGLAHALYEYLLIVFPVAIYISLESIHKGDINFIYQSAEWSIVTVFLTFISLSKFRNGMEKNGIRISENIFGIIEMLSLAIIIISIINTYLSFEHNNKIFNVIKFTTLIISTFQFFILLIGTKTIKP